MKISFTIFFFLSFFAAQWSFSQSDSTYWNREFHFGTTVFLDRKDLAFYDREGHFLPGYSASYALKKVKSSGKGFILNFGMNTFAWKSNETDYEEFLGEDFISVKRAVDYSRFKFTFSHIAFGYYYRKAFPGFFLELDLSPGIQLLNFSRYRDTRSYETGANINMRDEQLLDINIIPSIEFNSRLAYRIGKRHLLFFNIKYIGFFNLEPYNYYSFAAFNLGLSKDFMLSKRKLKNGKKYRDNYLYAEGLGLAGYYSVNYERNVSHFENFRLNLRAGFGYYDSYNFLAGINLVLGHRYDRFELAITYNQRRETESEIPVHMISPSIGYRSETPKNWLFKLNLGPAVKIIDETNQYFIVFGGSVGKRFGKR